MNTLSFLRNPAKNKARREQFIGKLLAAIGYLQNLYLPYFRDNLF